MKHGNRYKHGHALRPGQQSREYCAWSAMKGRCFNPRNNRFSYYAGRGITVCARWRDSFINFLADMGRCPRGYSLGRIDNDGDYEPNNCRWETVEQQANNRTSNRLLTARGITQNMTTWARQTGSTYQRITCRIKRGWKVEEAIFYPTKRPDISNR